MLSRQPERELSAELSSLVNKAYQTLLDDHKRGVYLLKLHGMQIAEGNDAISFFIVIACYVVITIAK